MQYASKSKKTGREMGRVTVREYEGEITIGTICAWQGDQWIELGLTDYQVEQLISELQSMLDSRKGERLRI